MKANELMIGDWVWDITPVVIDAIGNEYICIYRAEYGYITVNLTNLKPIPLTDEILEKNGFPLDVEETNHPLYKGTEIKEYIISMPPNEYKEHLIWNGEYYIMFDSPKIRIDYVHQLQHALRLCGIDKEIVL